jgi:hypothetical protein
MNRWQVVVFFFILFVVTTDAETPVSCPSIASVRHLNTIWPYGSWLPLYVKNNELALTTDIEKFSRQAHYFMKAGHCFYAGSTKIMLAHDMLQPNPTQFTRWRFTTPTLAVCISNNEDDCLYGGLG